MVRIMRSYPSSFFSIACHPEYLALSLCQPHNRCNVSLCPVFIVSEHIETGAGGGHQHCAAGIGNPGCELNCILHGAGLFRVGQMSKLLTHPLCSLADQDEVAHPAFHERSKRSVRAPTVLSSGYQGDIIEAFQSLDHASDICRLAVLVVAHPVKLADKLHPVMECPEITHADETLLGMAVEKKCRCQSRHDVFEVMNPPESKSGSRKACFTTFMPVDDLVPHAEHTFIELIPATEGEYPGFECL